MDPDQQPHPPQTPPQPPYPDQTPTPPTPANSVAPAPPLSQQVTLNPTVTPLNPSSPAPNAPPGNFIQPPVVNQPQYQIPSNKSNVVKKILIVGGILVIVLAGLYLLWSLVLSNVLLGKVSLADYNNETLGYSIKYPDKWEVKESNDTYLKYTTFTEELDVSNKSNTAHFYATMRVEKNEATSDYQKIPQQEYFRRYTEALRKAEAEGPDEKNPNSEYMDSIDIEESTVSGKPAILVKANLHNHYENEGEEGQSVGAFIWVNESLQYYITLTTHKSDSKFLEQWNDIIASFTLNHT